MSIGSAAIGRSQLFKDLCGKYFRITSANSVLSDAVNWQEGTTAIVRLKDTQEIYAGCVRTISRPDDQAQWICIDWPTKFDKDYNVLWPANKESTKEEHIAIRLDEVDVIRFKTENKKGFALDKGARTKRTRIEDAKLKNEVSKDTLKEKGDGSH